MPTADDRRPARHLAAGPAAVLLGLLLLLAAGCLDYEERWVIHPDGSGRVKMRFGISEQALAARRSGGAVEGARGLPLPAEEIKKQFRARGVKLVSLRATSDGVHRQLFIILDFKDIRSLKAAPAFRDRLLELVRDSEGNWRFRQEMRGMGEQGKKSHVYRWIESRFGKGSPESILAYNRVIFSVRFPEKVLDTNGTPWKQKTAIWSYPLARLLQAESLNMRAVGR